MVIWSIPNQIQNQFKMDFSFGFFIYLFFKCLSWKMHVHFWSDFWSIGEISDAIQLEFDVEFQSFPPDSESIKKEE